MDTLSILTTVFTSLSICGCILIFLAHKFWKDVRSKSRNILLCITISDLVTAAGYLCGVNMSAEHKMGNRCTIQSFVTTTSCMSSFFWTTCMALYLYAVSIKANVELGKKIVFAFHCIAWPLPLLISLIALISGKLGSGIDAVGWCWIIDTAGPNSTDIVPRYKTVFWMLITGKLWEIISYILIIGVYAKIWHHVRKQRKLAEDIATPDTAARFRAVEARTILIPKFFFFIRIWGTLRFLVYAVSGMKETKFLEYLQAMGDGSQGFVNAILFCLAAERLTMFCKACFYGKSTSHVERVGLLEGRNGANPVDYAGVQRKS